ncbi:dienelactone hydrolase [Shewanella sairae]|uniref:Dienelactone hydrolase n=1 Tax=Shewanella sairae TaxID=190310 RepID=A0ABQ4PP51_9GAMM|nr:hypothetical protein [Shewanella sairae]MCL1130966.1 hypothetical protein [Shewanella sairae]GIU50374.1 dienelactone hydrolase [Shewanella sairae]
MRVLLVSDIFGLCESTDLLISALTAQGHSLEIVEPYNKQRHDFVDETGAYDAFVEHCGHDDYLALTTAALVAFKPDVVIGFSAGANALWRASTLKQSNGLQFICFYPTRIHRFLDHEVNSTTEVIFPAFESAFDVAEIDKAIATKENVTTQVTPYQHGFMNSRSKAYSDMAQAYGLDLLKTRLLAYSAL